MKRLNLLAMVILGALLCGCSQTGKFCLQDHGSRIWFRNIKIREL